MDDLKIQEMDLYELLKITVDTSLTDIKKAHGNKTLQCHPDKNLANPNAAREFHRLSEVLKALADEKVKAA